MEIGPAPSFNPVPNQPYAFSPWCVYTLSVLQVLEVEFQQGAARARRFADSQWRLQLTKWMTMVGVMLAVGSSALLYVNLLLYFVYDSFSTNALLNPFATCINIDSVCNDLSMLVVCGGLIRYFAPPHSRNGLRLPGASKSLPLLSSTPVRDLRDW